MVDVVRAAQPRVVNIVGRDRLRKERQQDGLAAGQSLSM
jgi:hypothetical protein